MTGKTHKLGAGTSVVLLYPVLLHKLHEYGFTGEIWWIIVAICGIMLVCGARYGTVFPDLDHQNPKSLPLRTPVAILINKVLLTIGCDHRSWHTHSLDISLIIFGIPTYYLYTKSTEFTSYAIIYFMIFTFCAAFTLAVIIHLMMDIMTLGGIYISIVIPIILVQLGKIFKIKRLSHLDVTSYKYTLAPKNFWYIGIYWAGIVPLPCVKKPFHGDFGTGGEYEEWIRKRFNVVNYVLFGLSVLNMLNIDVFALFEMIKDRILYAFS